MNLLVDGVEQPAAVEPDTSLGAVLAQVDADLSARKRMIVSVNVDGREVSPKELGEESSRTIDGVQRVVVRSEPTAVLADAELAQVEEHLPALSQTARDIATLFQEGNVAEGLDGCERATAMWMGIVSSEQRAAGALRLDLHAFTVDGKPVDVHHAELNQFLQEALRAMERGDYVLLGDLFEHELATRLDTELKIVNELRKSLTNDLA